MSSTTSMTAELIVRMVDMATAPARAISKTVDNLTKAARINERQLNAVRGQMLDAAGAGYALYNAISKPVEAAMAFESAMADVRKVVDFETPEQFDQLGEDIKQLSTVIPMAADDIAAIVASAGQAGMAGDELLQFTEVAAKVGVAFGMSADQTGDALAKMKTALQLTVEDTSLLADAINHLSNSMASEAPEVLDFMSRVGSAGLQYGFTAEQTAAIGSAMIAAGADSNVAATSFRNVGKALTKGAAATGAQKKALKNLGLSATDVAKAMQKDAVGTLHEVLTKVKQLPKEMQAATMSQLFGDEARALTPLLENLGLYEDALGLVADKQKYLGSASDEYAVRAETTENKLQLMQNAFNVLAITIGDAFLPAVNDGVAAIMPLIAALTDFVKKYPEVVTAVTAVVGGLVAFRIAAIATSYAGLFLKGGILSAALASTRFAGVLVGLLNPMNWVRAAFVALRVAVIGTGIGAVLVGIAMAGTWIYNNWSGISAMFQAFGAAFMAAVDPIMPMLQPVIDGATALWNAVSGMLGPVEASEQAWVSWGEMLGGTVGGVITGTVAAIQAIPAELQKATDWAKNFATSAANMTANFVMGTIPEFFTWIRDVMWTGLSIALEMAWPVLPGWMQSLIDFVLTGLNIKLNVDWPEPPGWVKWAMENAGSGFNAIGDGWNAAGNAINDLFGGGEDGQRATGGSIYAGRSYLVGENGPEIITANATSFVHDARATADMIASMRPTALNVPAPSIRAANTNAANQNAPTRVEQSIVIGDIHLHNRTNARPQEIAQAVGDVVASRVQTSHMHGGE